MKLSDLSRPSSGDRHRPRRSRAKPGAKRGRPKGAKNLLTLERELQAKLDGGEELAKTWLVETMQIAGRMMRRYCPIDQNGNKRAGGDVEKFYRACELVTRTAVPLLPFQSPRLSAVAIAPAPPPHHRIRVRCTILDEHGRLVSSTVDGEEVELPAPEDTGDGMPHLG
jgi:hypothetical protein